MRISIRLKILIFFAAILVATSAVNLFFIGQILKKDYKSALYSELLVLGNNLQAQLKRITSLGVSTKDIEEFDQQCLELVKKNNNIAQAMIIDRQGTVVFHNDPSRQGKKLIHKDILDSIAEGRTGIYSIRENNENLYFAVFPFGDIPNRFEYTIVIVSPAKIINDKILSLINKCNVVLLSTFGLAAILLLTGLTTMLTAPLTVILNTMRDITKTRNLQKRVDIRTHDEIGQIADAFNQMTNDLQHSTTSVENLNSQIAERKNAESKLQLTQFSIDNSPDCAFRVRENGEFVYVNKVACDTLGYSKDELLSMKVCNIDIDMPIERWPQHWQEVKEKGFVVFESHHKTKNGTVFPVEMSIYFVNFEGQEYICDFARDISERKKVEHERLEFINRIRQQENAIVRISTNDALSLGDVREAMQVITEVTADTLKVERAGVWLFSKDGEKLECIDLFERSDAKHLDGISLAVDKYPRYLTALEFGRAIDASDARTDTRVSELVEEYLVPLDVVSMLDTPIRISGEIVGVICNESVGEKRVWTADEITFASEIADQAAQTLINAERKKVENELRSSETRFRQIVSNASEWIWEVDTNGLYTYSSPVIKDLLGYKPEEIVGKKYFYDLFTTKNRDELKKMAFETFATKQAFKGFLNANIHKDGKIVWLLTSGVPILDSNDNLVGYRGSDIDITERKKAEERIQKSQKVLQDMIDAIPFGVVVVGKDKRVRQVNATTCQLTGYRKEELLGQLCHKTLCPAQENSCPIFDQNQAVDHSERKLVRKDGAQVPILKSVVQLKLDDENVLLEAFIDITERKEIEEKLKQLNEDLKNTVEKLGQANQDMKNFVYIASHDLREPLRKITSFGVMLQKSIEGKLGPDEAENLYFMIEGARRLTGIIEGLLLYSRATTKSQPIQIIDLNEIVKQLQHLELAVVLEEKHAVIEVPQPQPLVEVDSVQISQLMQNLIANAIKYQKKGGIPHIRITSKPAAGKMVRIEITDNGIGIAPEYHQSIFAMFRQLHSSDEYESAGIGLAVCKRIVERHGGQIGVESQPGKGSTFWFTVPCAKKSVSVIAENKNRVAAV